MNRRTMPADELLLHADFLRRLAEGLVRRDDADDLYQDTWVAALRRPPLRAGNLRGWLQVIAANLGRNRRREQARRRAREQAAATAPASTAVPAASEIAAREEVRRHVVAAVLELPEPLRDVVLLRFYEGLDSAAIGTRLLRPASTVRSQLHSALERLRVRLDEQHGERRAGWALPLSAWARFGLAPLPLLAKAAWPMRAATVTLLLLALAVWFVPILLTPPPQVPAPAAPLLTADAGPRLTEKAQPSSHHRQAVEVPAAQSSGRGSEDLWGRVVRAGIGEPVPDAEVRLLHSDADQFECLDPDYRRQVSTLGSVHSDAWGRFAFRVARGGLHRISVAAADCAPVTLRDCSGGAEVVVEVGPGATVAGVVREGSSGTPLANVPVDMGREHTTTTTGDGAFAFRNVPAGRRSTVHVPRWMHLASASRGIDLVAGQVHTVEIALSSGRTVHGVVTDAVTDAPLADVALSDSWTFAQSVRTGVDGRYQISGLDQTTEPAELHAQAEGYARTVARIPSGADHVQVDIALTRGGTISGRLVDVHGMPTPAVYAAAGASFLSFSGGYHTDWVRLPVAATGRFQGSGLDPGRHYQLYVRGNGLGTRVYHLPRRIAPNDSLDLGDVVLLSAALLEGTITDAQGTTVAGATLALHGCNADHDRLRAGVPADPAAGPAIAGPGASEVFQFTNRETRSASDGSFRFAGLSAGSYEIFVSRQGHDDSTIRSGPHEVWDGAVHEGIRIVLDTGLTIRGRIRTSDGTPLPDPRHLSLLAFRAQDGKYAWGNVDAGGSFVFEGLSDGDYVLSLMVKADLEFALTPIHHVRAGSRDLDLLLQHAATIEGRVTDADGKPLRTRVHFSPGEQVTPFASNNATDGEGRFCLRVAPGCAGKVTVSDPNNPLRQASAEHVAAGTRDLVLTLR